MKSPRNLRLQIRLCEGALVLLLGLSTVAAVATHQLLLDAANQPTSDLDIGGGHVVGTLDAGRLSAAVPLLDGSANLAIAGNYQFAGSGSFLAGNASALNLNNEIYTDGGGNVYAAEDLACGGSLFDGGNLIADAAGNLYGDASHLTNLPPASVDGTDIAPSSVSVNGTLVVNGQGHVQFSNGGEVTDGFSNLFIDNALVLNATGNNVIDNYGNMTPTTATLPPIDPGGLITPGGGVTLYASSADGKLHALDAAGNDHALW